MVLELWLRKIQRLESNYKRKFILIEVEEMSGRRNGLRKMS